MDPLHRLEAKGLARAKLRAKRLRVQAIRSRVWVGSIAIFVVAWAIIFGQLVTGNDPVLARSGKSAKPVAATHRRVQVEPEPSAEPAPEEVESTAEEVEPVEEEEFVAPEEEELEAAPEEVEPEPEPAPVITSSS